jgi:hypothetical protein
MLCKHPCSSELTYCRALAQSEKDADKVASDLTLTGSVLESIKTQLGFQGLSLQEIEQRLFERKVASNATDVAGSDIGKIP